MGESRRPRHLHDFDRACGLANVVGPSLDRAGRARFRNAVWQRVLLASLGALCVLFVYVLPLASWREILADDAVMFAVLVAFEVLFAVPVGALLLAGLTPGPVLVVDPAARTIRRPASLRNGPEIVVPFARVRALHRTMLLDESGSEVSGPFEVLWLERDDGELVSLATWPGSELPALLETQLGAARED